MHDAFQQAREVARHWREANGDEATGGVVIVLDGLFVGHAAELPPAAHWAAGCLAVAADGQTHLARPTDFRGGLEWYDLGPYRGAQRIPCPRTPGRNQPRR